MQRIHAVVMLGLAAWLVAACARPSVDPGPPAVTEPPAPVEAEPVRPGPATVAVAYRYGSEWRPVTAVSSHVMPGSAELRISFSKPVRRQEVEQVLAQAQGAPVRGLMQWESDRTVIWSIAQLPPRIDFLLGGAHDQDGLPLPGGLTSLRVGEQPALVEVDLANGKELRQVPVPADVVAAALTDDYRFVNMVGWIPGTSRWDWHTAEFHLNLQTGELKHGRQESARPRITGGSLESWVINPPGTLVAALRPSAQGGGSDLVVMDPLGGRQLVYPRFVTRAGAILPGMLAWSADGVRVAAIAEAPEGGAGIVVLNVTDGEIARPVNALPVGAGARLLWSGSGRYILAGNLLVDLEQGTYRQLPGDPLKARGAWEPQGQRLLYSQEDWGVLMAVDPATAGTQGLGTGLLAGWTGPGRALLIRWPVSATRYVPIGH